MKVNEITPIIRKLLAAFPHANASAETIGVYVQYLSDIPLAHLTVVVDQVIIESEFLPTVHKIRERYLAIIAPERLSAADAWGLVIQQIMRVGHVGTPKFDDPVVAQVVKGMGWLELCKSENQMADRAHFIKMYGELADRQAQDNRATTETRRLTAAHRELRAPGMKSIGSSLEDMFGSKAK